MRSSLNALSMTPWKSAIPSLEHPNLVLGTPSPRSSRRWNFEISVTGAVTRHGVINWEAFGEKFGGSFCTANEARKFRQKFRPEFRPIFSPNSSPRISPGHKNLSPQFRSGECQAYLVVQPLDPYRATGYRYTYRTYVFQGIAGYRAIPLKLAPSQPRGEGGRGYRSWSCPWEGIAL